MKTTKLDKDECPVCGKELDAATSAHGNDRPSPGDISICIHCAAILRFDDKMSLEIFPKEVLSDLPADVLSAINKFRNTIKILNK